MKHTNVYMVLMLIALYSCQGADSNTETKSVTPNNESALAEIEHQGQAAFKDNVSDADALQVAKSIDDFSTLVAAIEAAGVQDAVVNTGPLTIFAPLNSAFAKLPEGTVETLLKPENKSKLAFVLVNHVAPSNYPIKQLEKEVRKGRKLYVASGKYHLVEKKGDDIYVGGTKILKSVNVSNGWIHVIDDVLVPTED